MEPTGVAEYPGVLEVPDGLGERNCQMQILVTGGAGFIGSHFARFVLTGEYPAFLGAQVTVLDALTYAAIEPTWKVSAVPPTSHSSPATSWTGSWWTS